MRAVVERFLGGATSSRASEKVAWQDAAPPNPLRPFSGGAASSRVGDFLAERARMFGKSRTKIQNHHHIFGFDTKKIPWDEKGTDPKFVEEARKDLT